MRDLKPEMNISKVDKPTEMKMSIFGQISS